MKSLNFNENMFNNVPTKIQNFNFNINQLKFFCAITSSTPL